MARRKIANLIKEGLKKAYQTKTAPLQAASKVARRVSPNSKIATALAALATPAILNPSKAPAKKQPPKEKAPPKAPTKRIKGSSRTEGGTYTQGKRTGSKAGGGKLGSPFGFNLPGDDMALIPRNAPGKIKRMKGGGLAIKGQGKAFLKSKR